ncbi:MAG: hypothetical protein IJU96_07640 [Clostridia bacterium]|nr:hypothetical protein [Clostridia bacterium]
MNIECSDYEIKNCFCCWYDLLGYGKPFVDSHWNLNDERCRRNYERIKNVRTGFTSSWSAKPVGTRLTFNDGFASTIDFDLASADSYQDALIFLEGVINDFESINYYDKRIGFPGIRGIITFGQRFSYDSSNSSFDISSKRTIAYFPSEFQMNTAFSKAFIMEESGSRANLSGNYLFIDVEVYNTLVEAAKALNYPIPQIEAKDNRTLLKVFDKSGWFADLVIDSSPYLYGKSEKYNNRGIETKLYKYVSIHSRIDEIASEATYCQSIRYSRIDEE